jgi:two-component SAPR family response regulator
LPKFDEIKSLLDREGHSMQVFVLGQFEVIVNGRSVSPKEWGRDKTIQLFQFLVTARHRGGLHKEQIMDRIWEDDDDKGFKVALHGVNKTLEPNRKSRSEPKYVTRQGLSYQLDISDVWIDAEALDRLIALGNLSITENKELAAEAYRNALKLYKGVYLPERLYEDWSSAERERIQIMVIGTLIQLAELLLDETPMETIRLCQEALLIDNAWEDAYRVQMKAYMNMGNRPLAIKTYEKCVAVLQEEFGLAPLPVTRQLFQKISSI